MGILLFFLAVLPTPTLPARFRPTPQPYPYPNPTPTPTPTPHIKMSPSLKLFLLTTITTTLVFATLTVGKTCTMEWAPASPVTISTDALMGGDFVGLNAGDVDGDSVPDILYGYAGMVKIAKTTYGPPLSFSTPYSSLIVPSMSKPSFIATAPIDGDVSLDVLATYPEGMKLFLNTGNDASFPTTHVFPLIDVKHAALGDGEGDGGTDVFLTNGSSIWFARHTPGISPYFETPYEVVSLPVAPMFVAAGHFDGSPLVSLAVVPESTSLLPLQIISHPGGLGPPLVSTLVEAEAQDAVASADINGDGMDDVLYALRLTDTVTLHLGTETPGNFGPPTIFSSQLDAPGGIAFGDLDGSQGLPDIFITNQFTDRQTYLINNGAGDFPIPMQVLDASARARLVTLCDLDADGIDDPIIYTTDPTGLVVYPSASAPTAFEQLLLRETGSQTETRAPVVLPFYGTTFNDIITVSGPPPYDYPLEGSIYRNSDGFFLTDRSVVSPRIEQGKGFFPLFWDGDDEYDLLVFTNSFYSEAAVLINQGGGSFGLATSIGTSHPYYAALPVLVDLDLGHHTHSAALVISFDGGTSFELSCISPHDPLVDNVFGSVASSSPFSAAGCISDDARQDLVYADDTGSATLSVYVALGMCAFDPPYTRTVPTGTITGLAVGDLNGDLLADVAVASSSGDIFWFASTGSSLVPTGTSLASGYSAISSLVVAPVDTTGFADIVFVTSTADVHALLISGTSAAIVANPFPISTGLLSNVLGIAVADTTGDNVPDIVYTTVTPSDVGILVQRPAFGTPLPIPVVSGGHTMSVIFQALDVMSSCATQVLDLEPGVTYTDCPTSAAYIVPSYARWVIRTPPGSEPAIINCTSSSGGVLFHVQDGGELTLENVHVVGTSFGSANQASTAVLVSGTGSSFSLISSNVSSCSTLGSSPFLAMSGYGGFLLVSDGASAMIESSAISDCTAAQSGGFAAVMGDGSSLAVSNSLFSHVAASSGVGGGVFALFQGAPSLAVTSSTFSSTTAHMGSGGVLYVDASVSSSSTASLSHSVFESTSAPRGGGGVLANLGAGSVVSLGPSLHINGCHAKFGGVAAAFQGALPEAEMGASADVPVASKTPASLGLPKVMLVSPPTVVGSGNTAKYGGLAYACDGLVNLTSSHALMGTVASVAGGVGYECASLSGDLLGFVDPGLPSENEDASSAPTGPLISTPPTSLIIDPSSMLGSTLMSGLGLDDTIVVLALHDALGQRVVGEPGLVLNVHGTAPFSGTLSGVELGAPINQLTGLAHLGGLVVSLPVDALASPTELTVELASTTRAAPNSVSLSLTLDVGTCQATYGGSVGSGGLLTCSPCSPGSSAPALSEEPCMPNVVCGENSVQNSTDGEPLVCVCKSGFFAVEITLEGRATCLSCPPGARCDEGLGQPMALPGFSQQGNGFVRCVRDKGCAGNNECNPGYTGYLCSACQDGYFSDGSLSCEKCPPGAEATLAGVVAALVVAAAGVALITAAMLARSLGANSSEEDGSVSSFRPLRSIPPTLSMIVVSFQTVAVVAESNLAWGSETQDTLRILNVFNVDVNLFASECTLGSFYTKYAVQNLIPALVLVFVVVFGLCAWAAARVLGSSPLALIPPSRVVVASVISIAPLLYIPLARSSLVGVDCIQLPNSDWVLDVDPSVLCFDSEWMWRVLPITVLVGGGLVLGLPVYFLVSLLRARHSLEDPVVVAQFGALYRLYRIPFFFFGVVDLCRRLVIVASIIFLSQHPLALIGFLLCVILVYSTYIHRSQPYFYLLYNSIAVQLDACILCVLLLGGASYSERSSPATTENILLVLTMICLCLLAVISLRAIVLDVKHIVEERKSPAAHARLLRSRSLRMILKRELPDLDEETASHVSRLSDHILLLNGSGNKVGVQEATMAPADDVGDDVGVEMEESSLRTVIADTTSSVDHSQEDYSYS